MAKLSLLSCIFFILFSSFLYADIFDNTLAKPAPTSTTTKSDGKAQGSSRPAYPIPSIATADSITVFVGTCTEAAGFFEKIDSFVSAHPNMKPRILLMGGEKSDVFLQSLKKRALSNAVERDITSYNITRVPTTIIKEAGATYKIVGNANIMAYKTIKVAEKTSSYSLLSEEGPSCQAIAVSPKKQSRHLLKPPARPTFDTRLSLPVASEKRQRAVSVPVIDLVPPSKMFVVSEASLDFGRQYAKNGYLGCCTDCRYFTLWAGPCSEALLKRLDVNVTPTLLDIDFKKGIATLREGS